MRFDVQNLNTRYYQSFEKILFRGTYHMDEQMYLDQVANSGDSFLGVLGKLGGLFFLIKALIQSISN